MTTEKMNVHQALAELKTLDNRIASAIREETYVVANKHSNTKIGGIEVKDFQNNVKSHYQKVTDLMKRCEAIKRAVVNSNAVTRVEVGGKTYTVAEAIDMKNHGLVRMRTLLSKLTSDYAMAKNAADRANGMELDRRADEHIKNMFGNTDVKGVTEEVKKAREEFIKAQTVELVDPIGILKQIENLEEQITSFAVNVDAALSVSNATTEITVEY